MSKSLLLERFICTGSVGQSPGNLWRTWTWQLTVGKLRTWISSMPKESVQLYQPSFTSCAQRPTGGENGGALKVWGGCENINRGHEDSPISQIRTNLRPLSFSLERPIKADQICEGEKQPSELIPLRPIYRQMIWALHHTKRSSGGK